jgi:hypothetical protein
MFVHTVAMVFILNFGGGGLNASVLLFFATLSGFLYVAISSLYYPHTDRFYQISIGIAFASLLLTLVSNPVLSLAFAVLFQIAITPLLISTLLILQKRFALAAAVGILSNFAVLGLTNFSSLYATSSTRLLHFFFVIIWYVSTMFVTGRHIIRTYDATEMSSTSALIGFLGIFAIMFGFPNVLAAWNQSSVFIITFVSVVGILASSYLIMDRPDLIRRYQLYILPTYLVSLIGVIFLKIDFLYYAAILLVVLSAFLLLSQATRIKREGSIKMLGIRMGGVQFLVLLLTFFQIATPFWTGMPAPLQPLLVETTRLYTLIIGLILPSSGMIAYKWRDEI